MMIRRITNVQFTGQDTEIDYHDPINLAVRGHCRKQFSFQNLPVH